MVASKPGDESLPGSSAPGAIGAQRVHPEGLGSATVPPPAGGLHSTGSWLHFKMTRKQARTDVWDRFYDSGRLG